jgi:hypothetical protein
MTVGTANHASSMATSSQAEKFQVGVAQVGTKKSEHGGIRAELLKRFGRSFSLYDCDGNLLFHDPSEPPGNQIYFGGLANMLCEMTEPKLIAEEDHVCVLALPLYIDSLGSLVAIAPFVSQSPANAEVTLADATVLGLDQQKACRWIKSQTVWPIANLMLLATSVCDLLDREDRVRRLEDDMEKVSDNLASTYEEISLLYGVTQNVRLSRSDEELGEMALAWMMDCMAVEGVAIQYLPVVDESLNFLARTETKMINGGRAVLDNQEFSTLIEHLELAAGSGPCVVNLPATTKADWPNPKIRQLIIAPLNEGDNLFGWLAAFNCTEGQELGTVEASLLSSVAAILGIHCGNHELYRQQNEFLGSVVHAMTSAIDAKDPYTCGHSDRVARVSVCLAQQLGFDMESLNRIYMAGLLHDVGKIGINDSVLRKPDKLTDEEFEHIKLHPELGCRILSDIRQLKDVLPVVLHHHEQWDGKGYPHGLAGEDIPLEARIVAVADAYDAMTSDRPYRKGMPVSRVEVIFRAGRGTQWDAEVIDAYFEARDEILRISSEERAGLHLDVTQWLNS